MQHVDQAGIKGIHSAKITILTCTNSVASRVSEESSPLMTSRTFSIPQEELWTYTGVTSLPPLPMLTL